MPKIGSRKKTQEEAGKGNPLAKQYLEKIKGEQDSIDWVHRVLINSIPHSTAYRKIRWLVEEKLLVIDRIGVTEDGKKSSSFRPTFRSFNIKYEHNNLLMEAEQNFHTRRKITENFFTLPYSDSPHLSI